VLDEYYVRDISGKEFAIYNGSNLQQWNIFGADNIGKITSDNNKFFYIKDHLGSIRAVTNQSNNVVSAQDYDCWGYVISTEYVRHAQMAAFTNSQAKKEITKAPMTILVQIL